MFCAGTDPARGILFFARKDGTQVKMGVKSGVKVAPFTPIGKGRGPKFSVPSRDDHYHDDRALPMSPRPRFCVGGR